MEKLMITAETAMFQTLARIFDVQADDDLKD